MKFAAWICAWLTFAAGARAAIIDTSMVIDAEHSFPGERIEVVDGANPPTVVDFVEGETVGEWHINPDIKARGRSRINFRGGHFAQFDHDESIEMYEESELSVESRYDDLEVVAH